MMFDLGPYVIPVMSAWAATLGLLGLLVAVSVREAQRARARLVAAEALDAGEEK